MRNHVIHNILNYLLLFSMTVIVLFTSPFAAAYMPLPNSPLAKGTHPRLLITQDSIPALRAAIATHYGDKFQAYVNWVLSKDPDDNTNILSGAGHDLLRPLMVHQAFIYALGEVPGITYTGTTVEAIGRLAIDRFKSRLNTGERLAYAAAYLYDWTYNLMTPDERSSIGTTLKSRTLTHKEVTHSLANPSINPDQMFSSSYFESFYAWHLALALWGDGVADAEANQAIDTFFDVMLNYGYLDAQNFVSGNDGGWSEWIGYSNWHPRSHLLLIAGWNTATRDNYFLKNGVINGNAIKSYPEFLYYAVDPHKYFGVRNRFVKMGGAGSNGITINGNRSMESQLHFMPRFFSESGLNTHAGLVRQFVDTYADWFLRNEYSIWGFLGVPLNSPAVSPVTAGLPKSRWMKNMGAFIARTGFESPADSVFFVSDGHYHLAGDRGVQTRPGFGINKFGPLIGTREVAHRTFGNLEAYPDAHRDNVIYFEGSHKNSRPDIESPNDLQLASTGQGNYDWGGIEQVTVNEDRFYHVRSNRSRNFTDNLRHTREYVWIPGENPALDSDFLVVYDRTQSPSKPHWAYHVPWKPEATGVSTSESLTTGTGETDRIGTAYTGSDVVIKALNDTGGDQDNDEGTSSFTPGLVTHGVAFGRTLLPVDARTEVTRVAKFHRDVLFRQGDFAISTHRWQVDVIPTQDRPDHRFLNVFQSGDKNLKTSMTSTSLIEVGNQMQGVWITRENNDRPNHIVLFNKEEGVRTDVVTYTISGNGLVRHIITGLKANTSYQIKNISSGSTSDQATEEGLRLWDYQGITSNTETGTIFFESTISGEQTYSLSPTGTAPDTNPPSPPSNLTISQNFSK